MAKDWDFSALDEWLEDVASDPREEIKDEYAIDVTYPWVADSVPRLSYVELAWLGYYRVVPRAKDWEVETCDGMVFRNADRREAIRDAQKYCTAFARGEVLERHLPKPLRKIEPKAKRNGEPPF
jgi:hypothetical protein